MNAQVTFKLQIFNLESEISAEELAEILEKKIEPEILQVIKRCAKNGQWVYELETLLKENIPISESAKQVFEASNIQVGGAEAHQNG